MTLVFDTETTGKADFRAPVTADHQPHLVQLGAQLLDEGFAVRAELNLIIKPEGFVIPKEAADIHGITQEIAMRYGVPLSLALEVFSKLSSNTSVFVAHNSDFDERVMATAFHRLGEGSIGIITVNQTLVCTMKAMTPVCKLPNRNGYPGYKWPTLQESHSYLFGCEFLGAHDAMADVRACARIYRWLKERNDGVVGKPSR